MISAPRVIVGTDTGKAGFSFEDVRTHFAPFMGLFLALGFGHSGRVKPLLKRVEKPG